MAKPPKSAELPPQESSVSYSTLEAAKLLGTSVQTVQRWTDTGHLRGWRTPGGHRRIEGASLDRMLRMAAMQPATDAPQGSESVTAGRGVRILVVDDSPDDLAFLHAVVSKRFPAAEVITASNGFAALIMIGRQKPDILVTDIAMQGFNGIEMILSLRDDPATATLPIIAVSGHKPEEIGRRFGSLPEAVLILRKPVAPRHLWEAACTVAPHLTDQLTAA